MGLEHMKFRSYRGFHKFRCTTMRSTRYVHDSKVETFLEAVKETATRRIHDLPARKCLWRAQLALIENRLPMNRNG